ncbi:hypothetical protein ACLB2K_016113 [Fragaria x ananassa]
MNAYEKDKLLGLRVALEEDEVQEDTLKNKFDANAVTNDKEASTSTSNETSFKRATFQRCMISIFSDIVEKFIEVFMDDFSVFGDSFDQCLHHLELLLQRCEESNLVLNWEKCHFMVNKGIVLGHVVCARGIEVDKAKVDVISKLPPPHKVKGIRSFLGHAGFYR